MQALRSGPAPTLPTRGCALAAALVPQNQTHPSLAVSRPLCPSPAAFQPSDFSDSLAAPGLPGPGVGGLGGGTTEPEDEPSLQR